MIPPPLPGERVRIAAGTFDGFFGVACDPATSDAPALSGVDPATAVVVMLTIFGRDTPVRIHPADLEPA